MSADLQTREQMLAEYNKRMDEVERKKPTVTITRAEYEALMAAAKELLESTKDGPYPRRRETREALAALRAAGHTDRG
jgi:hypothetical protein